MGKVIWDGYLFLVSLLGEWLLLAIPVICVLLIKTIYTLWRVIPVPSNEPQRRFIRWMLTPWGQKPEVYWGKFKHVLRYTNQYKNRQYPPKDHPGDSSNSPHLHKSDRVLNKNTPTIPSPKRLTQKTKLPK